MATDAPAVTGSGTPEDPWTLTTPPGKSTYQAYRDQHADPPALVCVVGSTTLGYRLRCIADLHEMLTRHGDWMALGNADEQKPAPEGSVGAWAARPAIPWAAGTGSRKGSAAGSATTCRRCSRRWDWPRWSTTRATTGCARCDPPSL